MKTLKRLLIVSALALMLSIVLTACGLFGGGGEPLEVPIAPPNFRVESRGDGFISLQWGGNTQSVDYYELSLDGGSSYTNIGITSIYLAENLTNGHQYTFKIRAVNEKGTSPESEVKGTPATLPTEPRNLAFFVTDDTITLSWQPPENSGGLEVLRYQIQADFDLVDGEPFWRNVYGTSYTYLNFSNGYEGYTYPIGQGQIFHVRAITEFVTETSATANAKIEASARHSYADGVPWAPQNLTVTAGDNQISLSWLQPVVDGNSTVLNYKLLCVPVSEMEIDLEFQTILSSFESFDWVTVGSSVRSHTFDNLENGVEYFVYIAPENAFGFAFPEYLYKGTLRTPPHNPQPPTPNP
ncbi:MAG: fibronectin type III domain-containing protein [Firmicutes bacterium]|nr:fibronectin type III domain-containing protein [Bacillota bacterium]